MSEPLPDQVPTVRANTSPAAQQHVEPEARAEGQPFGRYLLVEKLGKGGMGVVWKAYDTQLKRTVALKQIRPGEEDPDSAARFVREAQAAARLRHPNIVGVYEAGIIEGHHYLTAEYVEAKTLREVMAAEPLSPKKSVELVRQVAEALAYAHEQGIVHRDVKPENVLVDGQGKVFVMDFGLAKDVRGELGANLTVSGATLGTPAYMSPEQVRGWKEAIGPPTDQFSLGVVLYELLTGRLPFDGTSWPDLSKAIVETDPMRPMRLNPRLHRDLETICLKALEKDPLRRYDSMSALASDLGSWLEGEPIAARPISVVGRICRKASRHRRLVISIAGLALVAVVGLGWAVAASVRKGRDVAKALAEGREAEAAGNLEGSRDAYKAAETLAYSDEAKTGLSRVEGFLRERAAARAADEQQAERLLEDGSRSLDLAQRSLYNRKADYLELQKRVEAGKQLIEEAIRKAPEKARGKYLLGRSWKLLGRGDKAEERWHEAIRLDPKFGSAYFQLGMLFLERAIEARTFITGKGSGEEDRARADAMLSEARKHLALAFKFASAQEDEVSKDLLRVATRYVDGDLRGAHDLAAAAVDRFGDGVGCEPFHVIAAESVEGAEAARSELDGALRVCPNYGLAALLRAELRQAKGDLDGAIGDYDLAIAINPRDGGALNDRGVTHHAKGEYDRAIADFDAVLKINPRNANTIAARGMARGAKGDLAGEMADYEQAIAIDPQCAEAFNNRGAARLAKGNLDGAIADFGRAVDIDPQFGLAFHNRGDARQAKNDPAGAISDYDRAIHINPQDALALLSRGTLRNRKGDHDGAIADCNKATDIDPDDTIAIASADGHN